MPRGAGHVLAAASLVVVVALAGAGSAVAVTGHGSGGAGVPVTEPSPPLPTTPLPGAQLARDRRTAIAPAAAPQAVKDTIYAANRITRKPYRYGGGHRRWRDRGYDCSGSVSYALHGGGLLDSPLASGRLMGWGLSGPGAWITVYTNRRHAYLVIAGLRFDTSGRGERGPRWRKRASSSRGYVARHPEGM
jgi:hypothetical protein